MQDGLVVKLYTTQQITDFISKETHLGLLQNGEELQIKTVLQHRQRVAQPVQAHQPVQVRAQQAHLQQRQWHKERIIWVQLQSKEIQH